MKGSGLRLKNPAADEIPDRKVGNGTEKNQVDEQGEDTLLFLYTKLDKKRCEDVDAAEMRRKIMKKKFVNIFTATVTALALGAGLAGCGAQAQSSAAQSGTEAQEQNSADTQAQTDAADAGNANAQADGATESTDGDVTVIKAVTKGSPAPYVTIDENNQPAGSDIEIIKAVFERLPQYELQISLADDALTGIISGQYDIGVNNYGYREERADSYYFSYPYKTGYDVYIQRADDKPLEGLKDLADRGYRVEVGAGSLKANALEAWNAENPDDQIDILYSDADFALKFQHILDGTTDVAIDDGPIFDTLIPEFELDGQLVGNPIDEETQKFISPHNSSYFLFAKDEKGAALREDVDQALKEIKEDGTLAKILTDYFGKDTSPAADKFEETIN